MDIAERRVGFNEEVCRHPWEIARRQVLHGLVSSCGRLDSGLAIVDVGCGDAFVAESLAARYPANPVFGVDPALTDEMIAALQGRHSGVQLFRTIDALTTRLVRPAAVLLLADVLEHVEADDAFLCKLSTMPFVDARTHLIVTVPAYQSLFSAHDVFLRHFRRYTRRTLADVLNRSGWRVVEAGHFFASLVPVRVSQVLAERWIGRSRQPAVGEVTFSPAIQAAIVRALTVDASIGGALRRFGIHLPGLSAFATCRKCA